VKGSALAALAFALVTGCVPAPSANPPSTSASANVEITASTAGEIQEVLMMRYRALAAKDLTAFQTTFDLSRPAFRRCQLEFFDVTARQGVGASPPKVVKVEPYGNGYVRAFLDGGVNGIERRYFRRDVDRWIVSEPKADELGGERSRVVEGVRVDYWGIDEDVVDFVGHEAAATRAFLTPHAGSPVRDPYFVKLIPTRETAGIVACGFSAFADARNEHEPFLGFWQIWLAPSLDRISDYQTAVLRHEALHYLQDQFIHRINVRLDWWLIEGWPDYVARSRSREEIVYAVCRATPQTLKRIIDGVPTEPDTPPELTNQFYSQAHSMIEYMYATHGARAYWDLVALYKDSVDYRLNYPKVFGVDADVFYQQWLAFAKKKYC
jgi:hypothetical protein